MLGEEEQDKTHPPPPPPPPPAGVGGDNRRIYSRSVSWAAGRSPTKSTSPNPKSLWNTKAKGGCLPPLQPLSVSRPKAHEWPRAGSDDLGVWPTVVAATTPGVRPRPPALPLNLAKKPPREFEFKKDKLAFFDKECSRIIDHVFLGSDCVAKNRDVLRQNGITHVLNCVGFVCPEYFKNELVYKTLWLQDSPSEDITSILYDVFDYFEDVRERKGRVFVHCCQGVSRSTSLVIAYLMWREGHSFEEAFQQVKAARGVTNPNMGFASQLLQCQKRVHAVPVSPSSVLRMYRMAPHSSYAPLHLVPKLLARPNAEALDSRGAFIVNVPSAIYVWIGKDCDLLMYESARLAASQVIRYEKANGPALTIREGKEPIEFWDVLGNDQEQLLPGERKIANYDVDFGVFKKAANSGVVPPLSISGHDSEMCLPARRSGWERLRKKFATGVMKELIISSKEVEFFESACDSPDSCSFSDISESRDWVKTADSKGNEDDNSECLSPYSFSSFLVKDSRKFDDNTSPSLSPSTSDYSNSFSFSPTSSNWSDLSVSAQPSPSGLEASDPSPNLNPNPNPNPNPKVREISPSTAEIPQTLVRTWSFSMEDEAMEDAEDESLVDDDDEDGESMFDAENHPSEGSTRADFVLYQWPTMEEVEMGRPGIPDSRAVYITCVTDPSLGTKSPDVLYIWVGRDASDISGNDNDSYIQWQMVGRDFLVRKGLATSSVVQVVREGEEPEQLWKHLHCFSFQNTAEKGEK